MFCWITVHLDAHPKFQGKRITAEDARTLLNDLHIALAEAKVLVAPGWMFAGDGLRSGAPDEDSFAPTMVVNDGVAAPFKRLQGLEAEDANAVGHFRLAFATLEEGPMREVRFCPLPRPTASPSALTHAPLVLPPDAQTVADLARVVKKFFA